MFTQLLWNHQCWTGWNRYVRICQIMVLMKLMISYSRADLCTSCCKGQPVVCWEYTNRWTCTLENTHTYMHVAGQCLQCRIVSSQYTGCPHHHHPFFFFLFCCLVSLWILIFKGRWGRRRTCALEVMNVESHDMQRKKNCYSVRNTVLL